MQAASHPEPILEEQLGGEEVEQSAVLSFVLSQVIRGTPQLTLMNLQHCTGFEQWRQLVQQEAPGGPASVASMLASVLRDRMAEEDDIVGKLQEQEQKIQQVERASGRPLGDLIRQAAVLITIPDAVSDRISFQSFATVEDMRRSITSASHISSMREGGQQAPRPGASPTPAATMGVVPMEVGAIAQDAGSWKGSPSKGGKGKHKGKDKDKGKKGKECSQHSAEAAEAEFKGYCSWCSAWGHKRADCKARLAYEEQTGMIGAVSLEGSVIGGEACFAGDIEDDDGSRLVV